jgi:hypothetical protein
LGPRNPDNEAFNQNTIAPMVYDDTKNIGGLRKLEDVFIDGLDSEPGIDDNPDTNRKHIKTTKLDLKFRSNDEPI